MLEPNEELNRRFAAVIRKLGVHDKYFKVRPRRKRPQ